MNALELLLERQSDSKLTTPGPTTEQLDIIKQAALRAPDHAALKPWQFILVEGDAREKLGEIYYQAALNNNADDTVLARAKELPLRAPLIIICIAITTPMISARIVTTIGRAGHDERQLWICNQGRMQNANVQHITGAQNSYFIL